MGGGVEGGRWFCGYLPWQQFSTLKVYDLICDYHFSICFILKCDMSSNAFTSNDIADNCR